MVIVKSFSYLSLVTGLLINVLSVEGSESDTLLVLPSETLGTIARFLPEGDVYRFSMIGNNLLMQKMRTPSFYQTNSAPMCYNLANREGPEIKYIKKYMEGLPANSPFRFHLTHFTQSQLETIFGLVSKNKDSLIRRARDITRYFHWNKIELNNHTIDAWDLSDHVCSGNEEAEEKINNLAQSQDLQEQVTAGLALVDLVQQNNAGAMETINNFAQSPDSQVQKTAVEALHDLVPDEDEWARERLTILKKQESELMS